MAWVSRQNPKEVDRLFSGEASIATLNLRSLGPSEAAVLRYVAAEQVRWYFVHWENVQAIGGFVFLLILLFGSREDKVTLFGLTGLVLVVLLQKFLITPELIGLGRLNDLAQNGQPHPDASRYWVVHKAYWGVEATKWAIIAVLCGLTIFSTARSGRSRDVRNKLDRVDKPDYRRVNR